MARAGGGGVPQGVAGRAAGAQPEAQEGEVRRRAEGFSAVANYGVADVTTAATFQIASLYQDFGKAMIKSERPKKL
jgi:hypothetical protein